MRMKKSQGLKLLLLLVLLGTMFLVKGCGLSGDVENSSSGGGIQAQWALTTPEDIDSGGGFVTNPQIVVEPDGASTGIAVWLEERDEDPFDGLPPVTHLYARRLIDSLGNWDNFDSSCPRDGRLENENTSPTYDNGICLVDIPGNSQNASSPRISMDDNGDAILVWEQTVEGACDAGGSGLIACKQIYARTFTLGPPAQWETTPQLISDPAFDRPAVNPDIAVEPDGGGTAIAVYSQWDGNLWRIRATFCLDGAADFDTACGNSSGEWELTVTGATKPIDGGSWYAHSPRIGMADTGNAVSVFIRNANSTCYDNLSANVTNQNPASVTCKDDKLYETRFSAGSGTWSGPTNIDPGQAPGTTNPLCFEDSEAAGFSGLNSACFTTLSPSLSVDRSGKAMVIIKQYWLEFESALKPGLNKAGIIAFGHTTCHQGNHTRGNCTQGSTAFIDFIGNAIAVKRYNGSSWVATPDYLYSQFVNDGGATRCSNTTVGDNNRIIINCNLYNPQVALEPDGGGRAFAVYEKYTGTRYNLHVHQFNGVSTWTAVNSGGGLIETGSGDAHSPQIAVDNAGNAVAVWVQKDGSGKWRIYSNASTGSTWGTPSTIDDNVSPVEDDYYNPALDMDTLGSALSLFIGWSVSNSDATTRLYALTGP